MTSIQTRRLLVILERPYHNSFSMLFNIGYSCCNCRHQDEVHEKRLNLISYLYSRKSKTVRNSQNQLKPTSCLISYRLLGGPSDYSDHHIILRNKTAGPLTPSLSLFTTTLFQCSGINIRRSLDSQYLFILWENRVHVKVWCQYTIAYLGRKSPKGFQKW